MSPIRSKHPFPKSYRTQLSAGLAESWTGLTAVLIVSEPIAPGSHRLKRVSWLSIELARSREWTIVLAGMYSASRNRLQ